MMPLVRSIGYREAFWREVGSQLAQPRGLWGRLVARAMDQANAGPLAETLKVTLSSRPGNVLEIGFGSGLGITGLLRATPPLRAFGIDRSKAMVERATRRHSGAIRAGRVHLVEASADSMPWPDSTFDCVMAVNVAYFFGEAGGEMAEITRVLRPGGRLVLYVTHRDDMATWPFASSATHRHYDDAGLARLFAKAQFQNVEVKALALPFGITGLVAQGTRSQPAAAANDETNGAPAFSETVVAFRA